MVLHVQAFSIGIRRNSGDVLLVSPEHLIAAIEVSIEDWEDWQEQGRDSTRSPFEGPSISFHVPTDEEIELMRAAWRAECEDLDKEREELGAKDGSGVPPHRREDPRKEWASRHVQNPIFGLAACAYSWFSAPIPFSWQHFRRWSKCSNCPSMDITTQQI